MRSLVADHFHELEQGQTLVILPVSRLVLMQRFNVDHFAFHPARSCNLDELRTVPNTPLVPNASYEGQALREVKTSVTGVTTEGLQGVPVISFCTTVDWDRFLEQDHAADLRLLRSLAQSAERAMDIIKFELCRFDLAETLPSFVGSWDDRNGFSAAFLYTLADNESYLIAGAASSTYTIGYGLGLEIDEAQAGFLCHHVPPSSVDGEVGGIAQHALSLFSDVLGAPTPTVKYVRAMTLLEFLANPDSYENFKDAKTNIISHVAQCKTEYHQLCRRFMELSSKKDDTSKAELGYRTLLVHHGRYLEDIMGDEKRIKLLFQELQRYSAIVIADMLEHRTLTWSQFETHRDSLKKSLGVK